MYHTALTFLVYCLGVEWDKGLVYNGQGRMVGLCLLAWKGVKASLGVAVGQ